MPLSPRDELDILRKIKNKELSPREELNALREIKQSRADPLTEFTENPLQQLGASFGAGVNTGLLNVLGLPVDIANAGLNLVGLGSDEPIGGSANLIRLFSQTPFTVGNIEQVPELARPAFSAGRVVGESLPIAAAPLTAVRAGAQAKGMAGPILRQAGERPAQFAAGEALPIAGAAAGSAVAESVLPGNELARAGAEIVGGFAAPGSLILRASDTILSNIRKIRSALSSTGRRSEAGLEVSKRVEALGGDVEALREQLLEPESIPGIVLTAGQKTGNPALLAIERQLVKTLPDLDNTVRAKISQTRAALDTALRDAIGSGDPAIVTRVMQERERWVRGLMEARLAAAQAEAAEATARIQPRGDPSRASEIVREKLDSALRDARAGERTAWGRVPKNIEAEPVETFAAVRSARDELLAGETLPTPIMAEIRLMRRQMKSKKDPKLPTAGRLLKLRSRILGHQRTLRARGEFDMARILDPIGDAILDDLSGLPNAEEARAFSRQLNDLYTRGEVGRILGLRSTGAPAVPPELTLRGVQRGGVEGNITSRSIEEATQQTGLPGVRGTTTIQEQEDFIRSVFQQAIDPVTGNVRPQVMANLLRKNKELLDRFPNLRAAFADARNTQATVEAVARRTGETMKSLKQRAAFARVADFENPVEGINSVLSSRNPLSEYRQIASIARVRGGPQATAGLRRATLEALMRRSQQGGSFNGTRLRQLLNEDIGGISLLDVMRQEKIIDPATERRLNIVLDKYEQFENALANADRIDEVVEETPTFLDLLIRIGGAQAAEVSSIGQVAGGSSLVIAYAGSKAARKIFESVPIQKIQKIIAEGIENPKLMATLLKDTSSVAARREMRRQINAFLLQTAIPDQQSENNEFIPVKPGLSFKFGPPSQGVSGPSRPPRG